MKQERLQLNHRPDSVAGELGGEIEVVVRMKREQRIFQELYINRQSPVSKRESRTSTLTAWRGDRRSISKWDKGATGSHTLSVDSKFFYLGIIA